MRTSLVEMAEPALFLLSDGLATARERQRTAFVPALRRRLCPFWLEWRLVRNSRCSSQLVATNDHGRAD